MVAIRFAAFAFQAFHRASFASGNPGAVDPESGGGIQMMSPFVATLKPPQSIFKAAELVDNMTPEGNESIGKATSGRFLTDDCLPNPPDALDSQGFDCASYEGYEDDCGCCDDEDFVASRCQECPSHASCDGLPTSTTSTPMLATSTTSTPMLAIECVFNVIGATDRDGDSCSDYAGFEGYCGCCDDEDFQSFRCAECTPGLASCERRLEDELLRLPAGTEEIWGRGLSLVGSLPGNLTERFPNLTVLDLQENQLVGEIPEAIWHPRLRYLDLSENRLTGSLPETVGRAKGAGEPAAGAFASCFGRVEGTSADQPPQERLLRPHPR